VEAILAALEAGAVPASLRRLEVQPAPREALARVHEAAYLDLLAATAERPPHHLDADTYVGPGSWHAARRAAGGALAAVDALLDGRAEATLALGRPPGHHATAGTAMGFCLLNHVAVAARHAQARGLARVLVVDFDVHHGNGTQDIFYQDGSVLYVSTHQWGIYPGTGAEQETGAGPGAGLTLNVPLPALAGDAALGRAMAELVRPLADRFRPDLVLASAGFDAHFRDPLAMLQATGPGYHALATALLEIAEAWAGGRLAFVLEGGYDLPALANGVLNVVRALAGEGPDGSLGPAPLPEPALGPVIERLRARHGLG
jgi:acetoin utilization deacetylase AcuC-like enzyme